MGTYSSSVATKQALIMAAGELYAELGIHHVTVRAIALRSGENIGSITYHFGDKDGLLKAVLNFATETWQKDPLGVYLKKNERLFDTVEGQRKIVRDMVTLFVEMLFDKEKPVWCSELAFQVLQGNLAVSDELFNKCAAPVVKAFHSTHERIIGRRDPAKAFAWMTVTVSPIHVLSIDRAIAKRAYHQESIPESVMAVLKEMAIRGSLLNAGLWNESLDKELQ